MAGQRNPYVGPRTFEESDAGNFYGREAEARELLARAIADRLVLFYAQTGAGKSSLIHARLIPGLREEGFQVLPIGRLSGFPPAGIRPEEIQNIFVFNLLLSLGRDNPDPAELSSLAGMTLSEFLTGFKGDPNEGEWPGRVLVIDQFEELLTTHQDRWTDRQGFFQQMRQALEDDLTLGMVLTLREDFVAALDPYAELLPARWWRSRFYMNRMDGRSALEAVRGPATAAGRDFAPGVAERLIEDLSRVRVMGADTASYVAGEFVEPVQLQVVCYQLWQNLQPRKELITEEELQSFGSVDQVLQAFYDQAIQGVVEETGTSEWSLRSWFEEQLITEAGTRGTVYRGAEDTAGLANEAVDALARRYLLRSEPRAGGFWVEIIHDRLVAPIQASNRVFLAGYDNPLADAYHAWVEGGRDPELLLSFGQLREAEKFARENPADVTAEQQTLLELSRQASEAGEKKIRRQGMISAVVFVAIALLLCAAVVIITLQLAK
ncbi:MAG: hypothetical protein PVH65_13820 [Chloroflexota bacterium]|jgi:hypothetical protein